MMSTSNNFLMFPNVTYSFENGIYSSIINQNNNINNHNNNGAILEPTININTNFKSQDQKVSKETLHKKYINPFDPEATVPLPIELEDQFGPYSSSVWKRNERERCRVRNVNDGYERLRKHLPVHADEKRVSKVDTLRLAIRYIRHLDALLKSHLHQYNCKCFVGFQEESEGNIAIDLDSFGFSNLHHVLN